MGKADTFDGLNYEILEKHKDGHLFASKYDSREPNFKTPNIVKVFSNDKTRYQTVGNG